MTDKAFVPPPYPHDRLRPIIEAARSAHGDIVDLSIGTPCDPPPAQVMEALLDPNSAKGYPPSVGTDDFRGAVASWFGARFGVDVPIPQIGACVGTKELVAGLPHWLRLRDPGRDTVLYPEVSYPSYAMGALMAGCRAVPVAIDPLGRLDVASIDDRDIQRALCLWSNSPSNPTGKLDDLAAVSAWGRANGVPVFSDECYVEFTWARGSESTILGQGLDGVVSVQSLSKRSNLAGMRVGFFAGDAELVHFLNEIRKHSGLMVPGPAQRAGIVALGDQGHVDDQRTRYLERLRFLAEMLRSYGLEVELPEGGFYLWVDSAGLGGWELTERLAVDLGMIVSPGEFYGPTVVDHIRVAAVQPDDQLELLASRMSR